MKSADPVVHDIAFLAAHQAWTYRDLMDAPDDIVQGLLLLESKRG